MPMSWSTRIGVPTPGDPEGRNGPGSWWLTGSTRPALLPEWDERARARRARRMRIRKLIRRS
jgi:hypothetical protein